MFSDHVCRSVIVSTQPPDLWTRYPVQLLCAGCFGTLLNNSVVDNGVRVVVAPGWLLEP